MGGYVRPGKLGPTFVLERWIRGVHFHVSTKCRTERAALRELERFESDPQDYVAQVGGERITITDKLVGQYGEHLRTAKKDTREWSLTMERMLMDWAADLKGRDLRKLSAGMLREKLDKRKTSRRHRIEAIKGFCSWLRDDRELLNHANDATLKLKVPPPEPAKNRRARAVSPESVRATMAHLPPATRDVLLLQAGTAWHLSEVRRFSHSGEIFRPISKDPPAVLITRHKSGDLTRTPIDLEEHLAAAERIRAAGRIPRDDAMGDHMRRACEAVRTEQAKRGVPAADLMPHWRLGQMRHTVLSFGVASGATIQQASEFAHHRSSRTTARMYVDLAVPTARLPVMRLVKP
jgi:hypothetical protein